MFMSFAVSFSDFGIAVSSLYLVLPSLIASFLKSTEPVAVRFGCLKQKVANELCNELEKRTKPSCN